LVRRHPETGKELSVNVIPTLWLIATMGSGVEYGHDPTNIRWHLPAEFDTALDRARKEQRMLLIKGVSFNIDEAGAKCASKGTW
jgi:hypothetical protein